MSIERVAVLGAGVMGAQIAAHCANAGLEVLLLDIVPDGAKDRNVVAKTALARMAKADPAPFMSKRLTRKVTPGNLEDDLGRLDGVDWIVEAVIERLDVKHGLYARIAQTAKPQAILSSNTSTLPRAALVEGMDPALERRFLVTHFFNPPRYMRLLELVAGASVDREVVERFRSFAEQRLGKNVVDCEDTPGFIANRIGSFWIQAAINGAIEHGLTVEEADAIMGRPFGFPKTGIFGLIDLVGLDLIPYVDRSLAAALPPTDGYNLVRKDIPLLGRMIEEGYTGRKGKGGFYRLNREGGGKVKEAIDLRSGEYAPARKPMSMALEAARHGGAAALMAAGDVGAAYAMDVMGKTLAYAAAIAPDIAGDIASIDEAMRLGYNWKFGPFQLMDRLGVKNVAGGLEAQGLPVPRLLQEAAKAGSFYAVEAGKPVQLDFASARIPVARGSGVLLLADVKLAGPPITKNGSASLWDVGDGVACLEIHTKLNTIDTEVLKLVGSAIQHVAGSGKALVIYNEGSNFSAGANIGLALFAANIGMWPQIEEMVAGGQKAFRALKYAPFPVVAAPSGLALGGGCEICLAADAITAHAETYMGLVETGVGIVPAWGGCAEMLARLDRDPKRPNGPVAATAQAFRTIAMATVAKSAMEAREHGFLAATDDIVMHRDHLLARAKARALAMAEGYTPPEPPTYRLAGRSGQAALDIAVHDLDLKGLVTPHDGTVVAELERVLTGGDDADLTEPVSEQAILDLERTAFMRLVRNEATLARMEHTLETGKPLRN